MAIPSRLPHADHAVPFHARDQGAPSVPRAVTRSWPAAVDEVNLGRLLTLIDQLRSTSQLIVITHQKRTMEIADALYGVSMRGDGITGVISQRLRELETA